MILRVLEKDMYERYELFLQSNSYGMFFYSIKYKLLLEELLKCESHYLIVEDQMEIVGVLPMMKKAGAYGDVYNSLPFYGSHGGVLSVNKEAELILIKAFNRLSLQDSTAINMYVSNPFLSNSILPKYDLEETRIGQLTPIRYEVDIEKQLMLSFHSKTRNMVRKAQKCEMKVSIDNTAIPFLKDVHNENMKAIGGKAKSGDFFQKITQYFEVNRDYKIYVAEKDGIQIAALLLFYYNGIVEYFTPVVKAEYRSYQPMSLLIYHAMSDASKNGFKWWNWGGTWLTQDGVYHFKKRFGAVDKEYKYYIKVNNQALYNTTKQEVLNEYDNFYTIPFDKLIGGNR